MIGAIGNNVNGANSGSAFVYSGATGALLRTVHGLAAGNRLGYSGSTVGDVNADGFDDFIVGTFIPTGIGYARVYSGATGSVLYHLTDGVVGDSFGHSVAGIGDANGDGTPDFAVAAPNSNVGGAVSGFVRVYSGLDASVLREFIGLPGVHLGYCLNPAGDVNGDHLYDLAIGMLVPRLFGAARPGPGGQHLRGAAVWRRHPRDPDALDGLDPRRPRARVRRRHRAHRRASGRDRDPRRESRSGERDDAGRAGPRRSSTPRPSRSWTSSTA